MAKKKYIVCLTSVEREVLEKLTTTGKAPAYKVNYARILLKADTNRVDGGWTDESISIALDISVATIERVRQRLPPTFKTYSKFASNKRELNLFCLKSNN